MKQRKGRPRQFDYDQVIDAALEVFWLYGFEASSTEKLCERTGLGRGSLYHTFGNKQQLYYAALNRYQARAFAQQSAILEDTQSSLKARLHALCTWAIEADLAQQEKRSCMAIFASFERAHHDPIVNTITQTYVAKLEAVLCHQFSLSQRQGYLSTTCSALEHGRAFLASYYGLRILGTTIHERGFLEDIVAGLLSRYP